MAAAVVALYAKEPEGSLIPDDAPKPLVPLNCPAVVGSTYTSQALNNWLTQACNNCPGVDFDTDMLATTTRTAQYIRDPQHLRTMLQAVVGIDLVFAPIMDLPVDDEGNMSVTRAALEPAVLAATSRFYLGASHLGSVDNMSDMAERLYEMYENDSLVPHTLIEVFQYWDLIPDETLFLFVSQYFLCKQVEDDYEKTLLAQIEKKKQNAEQAREAALASAVESRRKETPSHVAVVPATSD